MHAFGVQAEAFIDLILQAKLSGTSNGLGVHLYLDTGYNSRVLIEEDIGNRLLNCSLEFAILIDHISSLVSYSSN